MEALLFASMPPGVEHKTIVKLTMSEASALRLDAPGR